MAYSSLANFRSYSHLSDEVIAENEPLVLELLEASHDEMQDYFRTAKLDLPIPTASVSRKMKQVECWIAAYNFIGNAGFDPTSKSDEIYYLLYTEALKWLSLVAQNKLHILPLDESGNQEDADSDDIHEPVSIASETSRSWGATVLAR
jgi:hypothetical protein